MARAGDTTITGTVRPVGLWMSQTVPPRAFARFNCFSLRETLSASLMASLNALPLICAGELELLRTFFARLVRGSFVGRGANAVLLAGPAEPDPRPDDVVDING